MHGKVKKNKIKPKKLILTPAIKLKLKLKKSGYYVWSNNGKAKGLEASVDLLAVKQEYAYLIQIKKKDGEEMAAHGVRGLQEVSGHSDFIIPTYVYPEENKAINLRTRLEVLKEIWKVERS